MDEKIIAALVAGSVSILVSLLSHMAYRRRLRHEYENTSREMAQKFAEELLRNRLKVYPKGFDVTTDLGKGDPDDENLPEKYKQVLSNLREWKTGDVEVVISDYADEKYQELIDRLKKKPGRGNRYSKEQVELIWHARQRCRGSLRQDLGLMRHASNMKIILPEDEA